MPQPGETKQFPNGKQGRWDGQGWEAIDAPAPAPTQTNSPSLSESLITKVGLPAIGGIIGGKTPLGPVGSGIGAATGQAYGDLYNMFAHPEEGIPTPMDEAKRLATTAGLTTLGEKVIPPVMNAVGSIRKLIPAAGGSGLMGGGALGYFLGHPQAGAEIGAALDTAPQIAKGVEWAGTPAKSGPLNEVPDYLKQDNWGQSLKDGAKAVGGFAERMGSKAHDALMGLGDSLGLVDHPPAPAPDPISKLDEARSYLKSGYSRPMAAKLADLPTATGKVTNISHLSQLPDEDAMVEAAAKGGRNMRIQRGMREGTINYNPSDSYASPARKLSLSENMQEGLKQSDLYGDNTVGAAQQKGSKIAHDAVNFTHDEFPPGTDSSTSPADWITASNNAADAQVPESNVAQVQDLIAKALDGLKKSKGR